MESTRRSPVIPTVCAIMLAFTVVSCSPPARVLQPTQTASPTRTPDTPSPTPCIPVYTEPAIVFKLVPVASFVTWALADFTSDGLPDILVARGEWRSPEDFEVDAFVNDGVGGLKHATESIFQGQVPRTQNPSRIVTADFNGDGIEDFYISDTGDDRDPWPGYQNKLILAVPGGGLVDATQNIPQQSDFTHSAAAADIDNDGDIDIYAGNTYGGNRIPTQILLNDGEAHFTVAQGLLPAIQTDVSRNGYTSSLFADITGDGFADLILGPWDSTEAAAALINDGTGHFSLLPDAIPPKPNAPTDIALAMNAADVNADGFLDLLISWTKGDPFYQGRYIQVLMNKGDATFLDETQARLPPQSFEDTYWWYKSIDLADADEDGDLDILPWSWMDHMVYENDGAGRFKASSTLLPVPPISTYSLTDFDGDGHKDLVSVVPSDTDDSEAFSVAWRTTCE